MSKQKVLSLSENRDSIVVKRLPANVRLSYIFYLKKLADHSADDKRLNSMVERVIDFYFEHHPETKELAEAAIRQAIDESPSEEELLIQQQKAIEARLKALRKKEG